jgi:hypothetical protein
MSYPDTSYLDVLITRYTTAVAEKQQELYTLKSVVDPSEDVIRIIAYLENHIETLSGRLSSFTSTKAEYENFNNTRADRVNAFNSLPEDQKNVAMKYFNKTFGTEI